MHRRKEKSVFPAASHLRAHVRGDAGRGGTSRLRRWGDTWRRGEGRRKGRRAEQEGETRITQRRSSPSPRRLAPARPTYVALRGRGRSERTEGTLTKK